MSSTLPGPLNAITDVPGVRVGHETIWRDGDDGIARTGVTAIVPDELASMFHRPMAAGAAVLNGAGELTGSWEIAEWGALEAPILLTGTVAVSRALDGLAGAMIDSSPAVGIEDFVIPTVGECDDSWLDEARRRWVTAETARAAIDAAVGGPVRQGAIGAGTGMITFDRKAGIGTSSRVVDGLGTVGVLVLSNFGSLEQFRLRGLHVGEHLERVRTRRDPAGSCIGVVATDIPLTHHQCERVAARVGLGLARLGSVGHHGSGEIFLAFSTTNRNVRRPEGIQTVSVLGDGSLNPVFEAVVDATEEAVLNALFCADTVIGRDGNVALGLEVDEVLSLLR